MTWRALKALDLIVEVAGNSALYRTDLGNIGEPVAQLALGGLWHLSENYGLRIGFFEDLRANSAPDFGLELSLVVKRH